MSARRGTVLVVEDEKAIRDLLRLHLDLARFEVHEASDGRRGLDLARGGRFDVIILDIMLPGLDGVTVCRAIRAEGASRDAPILMLPARVEALLRRQRRANEGSAAAPAARIAAGELALDVEKRQATVRGTPVELTRQEFDLLALLAARPGMVFSRAALLQQVWRGDTYVTERTVDTVVSRLRRKIEIDAQNPAMILTAWGVGYKFADNA